MRIWSFEEGGRVLSIRTPNTPTPWKNLLFNDSYMLDATQRLQGAGVTLSKTFNTKEYITADRDLFVRVNGEAYRLLVGAGKSYECRHEMACSTVCEEFDGFTVTVRVFVPAKGEAEIWTVNVENTSGTAMSAEVFTCFGLTKAGTMGQCARWDEESGTAYRAGFPYYVYYEEYENALKKKDICYVTSDVRPVGYETNNQRFFGADNPYVIPEPVRQGKLGCAQSEDGMTCGALHFAFDIASGASASVNILAGVAKSIDEVPGLKAEYLNVDAQLDAARMVWEQRLESYWIDTPDDQLNAMLNVWLKKQALFLGKFNRASTYCPIRNQLQDAMGYALIDPDDAFRVVCDVMAKQHYDGYITGWVMTDGSAPQKLCLIEHSDGDIWLILCFVNIIEMTGNSDYYNTLIGYGDSDEKDTVLEHLKKAARYMGAKTGERGMCLMLDGDWTDPLNGPGRKGKGESVWNTAALCYAIRRLVSVCPDDELTAIADRLDAAMNENAWDGDWYLAGIDDDGRPYGTHKDPEAKEFLNAQSFAILAGIARGERLEKVVKSFESLHIDTGYLLFAPEFNEYNAVWGRISAKNPGTAENGCAYCHGTMFKAASDIARGDADAAFETLYDVLPINPKNPTEQNLQSPTFIPNFYFSLPGANFGRSSLSYGTGSVAWFLWMMVEYIVGIRHTGSGVVIEPHFPTGWKKITASRRYRGELREYEIEA